MGETADQTRDEIVRLRAGMTEKVIELRRAADRPIRIAKRVAIGAAAVVVVGGVAVVVMSVRRRAERRGLRGRVKILTEAAANPEKAARKVADSVDKRVEQSRTKLREELREELKKELKDQRPMRERVLSATIQSAASAAMPILIKKLEEKTGTTAGARSKS